MGDNGADTADRVHMALSGGDLRPGDDGFGQAVAARARADGAALGAEVSAAARGGNAGGATTSEEETVDTDAGTPESDEDELDDTVRPPVDPPATRGAAGRDGKPASKNGSRS